MKYVGLIVDMRSPVITLDDNRLIPQVSERLFAALLGSPANRNNQNIFPTN